MPPTLTAATLAQGREFIATGSWPYMRVWALPNTRRARELCCAMAFVEGTQHDHLASDWDGRPRDPGVGYLRERMDPQGFVSVQSAVAMPGRKPNAHLPIARQVTMRFTEMLLDIPPTPTTSDDRTDRFLDAIMREAKCWNTLQQSRDSAGGCGSAAILLSVQDGKPCSERIKTSDLWVVRWRSGPDWIPELVIEQRLVEEERLDPESGELRSERVWKTRAWDETHSYTYVDVPESYGRDATKDKRRPVMLEGIAPGQLPYRSPQPEGEDLDDGEITIAIDADGNPMIYEHKMGRCPVIWLQNTRNTESPEGDPDSSAVWHLADRLDRLQSMVVRASIANVDPTLVYSDDQRHQRTNPILKKGWGQVIRTGPQGKASFLETSGESVKMGWDGIRELREQYLQTVGCFIVDAQTAGTYKSGEALQLLRKPMEHVVGRKRVPLGDAIVQICEAWIVAGRQHKVANADDEKSEGGIALPPWIEEIKPPPRPPLAVAGEEGEDATEPEEPPAVQRKRRVHEVGDGRCVELSWPPFDTPTAAQLLSLAQALGVATGQKQILSQETATSVIVNYLGKGDPADEYQRVQDENRRRAAEFGASMFGGEGADDEKAEDGKDAEETADREAKKPPERPAPVADDDDDEDEDE